MFPVRFVSLVLAVLFFVCPMAKAATSDAPKKEMQSKDYAFIVSGIAGDKKQEKRFQELVGRLYDVLVDRCGYDPDRVWIFFDGAIPGRKIVRGQSDLKSLKRAFLDLSETVRTGDSVFFVLIGHGDRFQGRPKLHLRGPDLSARQFAAFLDILPDSAKINLILSMSYSGDWIKPVAKKGRLIIAATPPKQRRCYETVFPECFLNCFSADAHADQSGDRFLTFAELFGCLSKLVAQHFAERHLVPTEEPVLEDSGDGAPVRAIAPGRPDGSLARKRGFHLRVVVR